MENEKRKVGDYTVLCAVNIGSREIILAENEQDMRAKPLQFPSRENGLESPMRLSRTADMSASRLTRR